MVALVSRQGRALQRYRDEKGGRLVVGCIPYKFKGDKLCGSDGIADQLLLLVISSQKGDAILFPKGGWEMDEKMKEAACREALEEAGVEGNIENNLGTWLYNSRRHDAVYEGKMFPLYVTKELDEWSEMGFRKRSWVTVAQVKEGCPHEWMLDALDKLVTRLSRKQQSLLQQKMTQQQQTERTVLKQQKQMERIALKQQKQMERTALKQQAILCK